MKRTTLIFAFILLLSALSSAATHGDDQFFSLKRFRPVAENASGISADERIRGDIKEFLRDFSNGMAESERGNSAEAVKAFLAARDIWPEFYASDFALALEYEKMGNVKRAASFYKSYLKNLEKLESLEYRISAPVIISIMGKENIEDYPLALTAVTERLLTLGIDIKDVKEPFIPSKDLIFLVLLPFFLLFFAVLLFMIVPYFRRKHRLANPPEGFWICKHCLASSPLLSDVCIRCSRPREEK